MPQEFKYEVVKNVAVLNEDKGGDKQFNIVKWGDLEPMYDIRRWKAGQPNKGLALTREEAEKLFDALKVELGK